MRRGWRGFGRLAWVRTKFDAECLIQVPKKKTRSPALNSRLFNTSKSFINPHSYTGDNAYPDSDSMLTPSSSGSVDLTHDAYNFFQSQIRIHIERAFGILNTVFGILQKPLKYEVPTTCLIVQACLRLHNWRIDRGCQVCIMTRCCHLRAPMYSFYRRLDSHQIWCMRSRMMRLTCCFRMTDT